MSEYIDKDRPQAKWYIVYTTKGYEFKVQEGIQRLIENNNLGDEIFETVIPTEEECKTDKKGKKKTIINVIMPSYVFVKMIHNNKTWYLINNLSGVINFVGPGGRPTPISLEEVRRWHLEDVKIEFTLNVGDTVKVIDGSLAGFIGTVQEADNEKKILKVLVSMFGRDMSVELEYSQVEKAKQEDK